MSAPGAGGYGTVRRGATSGVLVVPIADDDLVEPYESATARLAFHGAAPAGVRIDPLLDEARVTIADNDVVLFGLVEWSGNARLRTFDGAGRLRTDGTGIDGPWRRARFTDGTDSSGRVSPTVSTFNLFRPLSGISWVAVQRPAGRWHPFSFQAGSGCVFIVGAEHPNVRIHPPTPPAGTLFLRQGESATFEFRTVAAITSTDGEYQPRLFAGGGHPSRVGFALSGPGPGRWRTLTVTAARVSADHRAYCDWQSGDKAATFSQATVPRGAVAYRRRLRRGHAELLRDRRPRRLLGLLQPLELPTALPRPTSRRQRMRMTPPN